MPKKLFPALVGVIACAAVVMWFISKVNDDDPSRFPPPPTETGLSQAPLTARKNISSSGSRERSRENNLPKTASPNTRRILEITESTSFEMPDELAQKDIYERPERLNEETSYLTQEELDHYIQLDDAALLSLAESGDPGAQTRLGSRLIRKYSDVDVGIDWLIEAASYGSFEALRELRWLYQYGAGPIQEDDFAFLAWAKVAYMVGDWQALWFQNSSSNLNTRELMVVDVLAANYFDEINNRHILRTGQNMEIKIRPGYREALQQFLGERKRNSD